MKLRKIIPVVCAAALMLTACGGEAENGSADAQASAISAEEEVQLDETETPKAQMPETEEVQEAAKAEDKTSVQSSAGSKQAQSSTSSKQTQTSENAKTSQQPASNTENKQNQTAKPAQAAQQTSSSESTGGQNTSSQQAEVQAPAPAPEPAPSYKYKDGTFSGSAQGYAGPISVSVTISKDKITSVSVTSTVDDEPFISDAKTLCSKIVAANSADVSGVSGATYSSNGIKGAVKAALSSAKN